MIEKTAGWPVNFDITGPICARPSNSHSMLELELSGHHDWPVMSAFRSCDLKSDADAPEPANVYVHLELAFQNLAQAAS